MAEELTCANGAIEERPSLRLAFRQEGIWWRAYCASTDTMEGAIEIAATRMITVENSDTKEAFMSFCRLAFNAIVTDVFGQGIAKWGGPQPAPVHEKGSA